MHDGVAVQSRTISRHFELLAPPHFWGMRMHDGVAAEIYTRIVIARRAKPDVAIS